DRTAGLLRFAEGQAILDRDAIAPDQVTGNDGESVIQARSVQLVVELLAGLIEAHEEFVLRSRLERLAQNAVLLNIQRRDDHPHFDVRDTRRKLARHVHFAWRLAAEEATLLLPEVLVRDDVAAGLHHD